MQHKLFTIKGTDIEAPVTTFIQRYYQTVHESIYPGGFIRIYEDYSLMNDNDLAVCLRADTTKTGEGIFIIEMIIAGASGGLGFDFGIYGKSEHRRIKNFTERLQDFCKENGFVVEG